jgi:hypothetical protein
MFWRDAVGVFDQDEGREHHGGSWLRARRLMSVFIILAAASGAVASVLGRTTIGIIAACISLG